MCLSPAALKIHRLYRIAGTIDSAAPITGRLFANPSAGIGWGSTPQRHSAGVPG